MPLFRGRPGKAVLHEVTTFGVNVTTKLDQLGGDQIVVGFAAADDLDAVAVDQ